MRKEIKRQIKIVVLFTLALVLCGCGEPSDKAKGFKIYEGHIYLWTNDKTWSNGEWMHDPQCPKCIF